MTLRLIIPTHLPILTLGLLAVGCLAPDPDQGPSVQVEQEARVAESNQRTRTPLQIDPAILADRAFKEAPMLAERVGRGELPPVSERLPENPLVVVPMEEIGRYGGKLRRALTGDIVQTPGVSKTLRENLMGYERPLAKSIQLSLAESYAFQDEGRIAIFKIRKDIKWSDGVPFTVDDILFWYDDMTFNDDARNSPLPPRIWTVDDRPIRMEKVDAHTLKISSPKPLGRVLNALCLSDIAQPKHILARYHPRYSPEATYEAFRDSTTTARLLYKPSIPTLSAWAPVRWDRGQRILYERNPYYWKVDTEGHQLPYADQIEFTVIQDPQVILLKFINVEIDLFGRYSRIDMFPTLKAEEGKGKFKLLISGPTSGPSFYLNWDAPKPALRQAFRDRRVRIALSYAIHREEINQILFHGLLRLSGYSFGPLSPYFSEEAAQKYAEYDPDRARSLLEEAGYRDTDGDGFREFKNGSRFELNIDVTASLGTDVCELVADQWGEIGIKVNLNVALRDIAWPRRVNGEFDIHYWVQEGPGDPLVHLDDWAIVGSTLPFWHRNASAEGPEWFHEVTRYVNLALTTVDTARLREHMVRVRDLHTDNIPVIVAGSPYHVWGASTRLGNVPPDNSPLDEYRGWSRPVFHEQIFIRERAGN